GVLARANDVWTWCEKAQTFGRTVTVKIKFADFQQITRSCSFTAVVATREQLRQASLDLIRSVFPPTQGIRLVGVTMSNFPEPSAHADEELPLFAECDIRARARAV